MTDTPETNIEKTFIDTEYLTRLAIYLEGMKAGKGNLNPLGTVTIEVLWNTIKYIDGDVRFTAKIDKK